MRKWGIALIVLDIAFLAFTGLAAATSDNDTFTRCEECYKQMEESRLQDHQQSTRMTAAKDPWDPKKYQIPLTPELDNLPANRTIAEKLDNDQIHQIIWHLNDNLLPEQVREMLEIKPLTEEEKAIRVADVRWLDENGGYRTRTMTVGDFAQEYSTRLVGKTSVDDGLDAGYYTISVISPCSSENITAAQKRDVINLCNFMLAYGKQSGYDSDLPLLVINDIFCDLQPDQSATFYIPPASSSRESVLPPAVAALSTRMDKFRPLIAGIQYRVITDSGNSPKGSGMAATLGFPATKSDGTAVMVTCGHGNPAGNSVYQPTVLNENNYGSVGDRPRPK